MGPERRKVRFLSREKSQFPQDSGWLLCSGEEGQPLNPADFVPTALVAYVREDPSLEEPLKAPIGSEWTRKEPEDVWLRVVGDDVVDDSGKKVGSTR